MIKSRGHEDKQWPFAWHYAVKHYIENAAETYQGHLHHQSHQVLSKYFVSVCSERNFYYIKK